MSEMIRRKIIPGTNDRYEVTEDGRVYDRLQNRFLILSTSNKGYKVAHLRINGKFKTFSVHRLVAMAFVPGMTEERNQVNHKNENKTDNRAENLAWVTPSENTNWNGANLRRALQRGRAVVVYMPDGTGVKAYASMADAARDLGVCKGNIWSVVEGHRKTCGGYCFKAIRG